MKAAIKFVVGVWLLPVPGSAQQPDSVSMKTLMEWDVEKPSFSSEVSCSARVAISSDGGFVVVHDGSVLSAYGRDPIREKGICLAADTDWFGLSGDSKLVGWLGVDGLKCSEIVGGHLGENRFAIPMDDASLSCVSLARQYESRGDILLAGGWGGLVIFDIKKKESRLVWDDPCLDFCLLDAGRIVLLGKPPDDVLNQHVFACVVNTSGHVEKRWSVAGATALCMTHDSERLIVAGARGVDVVDIGRGEEAVPLWRGTPVSDIVCVGERLWAISGGSLYCMSVTVKEAKPRRVSEGFVSARLAPYQLANGVAMVAIRDRPAVVGSSHLVRPMRESITLFW